MRRVTNVAFVNRNTREILLHKRVKKKYEGQDFWAFFGGRNDPGENAIETILREIEEELQGDTPEVGMKLESKDLIHVCHTEVEKENELIKRDVFLVLTDKTEKDFKTKEKEGEDGVYFPFEAAKYLLFRNDIRSEIQMVQSKVEEIL